MHITLSIVYTQHIHTFTYNTHMSLIIELHVLTMYNKHAYMICIYKFLSLDTYGSSVQRTTFLPNMCTLDTLASYCLTEPGSGSDAASLQTNAVLDAEKGEYVVNGNKAFISGAGALIDTVSIDNTVCVIYNPTLI